MNKFLCEEKKTNQQRTTSLASTLANYGSTTDASDDFQSMEEKYSVSDEARIRTSQVSSTNRIRRSSDLPRWFESAMDQNYGKVSVLGKADVGIEPRGQRSSVTPSLPPYTIDKINETRNESASFDEAARQCGHGRYHHGLFLLCGLILMTSGFQFGLNAYILPSASCDLRLTSEEKGLLNVGFLIGGTVSAMLWGVIADLFGRKNVLGWTLLVDGIVTIVSSFSQSFAVLFVFRFVNGFVVGAPGTLVFTYIGEFHQESRSAKVICYMGLFFTLAWLVLPGVAWFIVPLPIDANIFGTRYQSWRLFIAMWGLPAILAAFLITRYPESPKFLLSQGKTEDALRVFRDMFASNTGKDARDYPVKSLLTDDSSVTRDAKFGRDQSEVARLLGNLCGQIRCLFTPPLLKYVILLSTILFTCMFGYQGLGLWLPELFNRFETYYKLHPNTSVSVCELTKFTESPEPVSRAMTLLRNATETSATYNDDVLKRTSLVEAPCVNTIDERVFFNTLIVNAVSMIGNVASGFLADRLGRRTLPVSTMMIAGIFGLAVYFLRSSLQNLIVACLFSLFIATANMVLNSVVVDIFPTHVSATAFCLATLAGRLGAMTSNLLIGLLVEVNCAVPIFLIGAMVIFGGLLGFFIPTHAQTTSTREKEHATTPM